MAVVSCDLLPLFIAVTGLTIHESEAAFKTVPQNEIALFCSEVEFQCRTDSSKPLIWSVTHAHRETSEVLFVSGNLSSSGVSRYRIERSTRGQYNLIIAIASFVHAGQYKCSEGPHGPEAEAELAVIDSIPLCHRSAITNVVETEHLVMECRVFFAGKVDFATDWFKNGSVVETEMVHTLIESHRYSWLLINSTLRHQVNSSDNGAEFIFKTTFRQRNNSRETVVIRNFIVSVLYGPKNLIIEPRFVTYEVGDSLKCLADGNPTPSYEWTQIGTETGAKTTIDGPVLIIDETMISDKHLHFQCTARNDVKGEWKNVSESVTFIVTEKLTNLKITPIKSVYEIGDRLECMADGNPTPNYEWTELQTDRVINGSVLTIDDYMRSDHNHSFRCTAYNTVAGFRKQISDTITFTVAVSSLEMKTSTVTMLVVGVGLLVSICILVSLVVGVRAHQKDNSEQREKFQENRNTQQTSDVDHQSQEETSRVHHPSQQVQGVSQSLDNEGTYDELMEGSSTVHQQDTYNQLHIYGNASAHAEYYVNQRDIELGQQSPEYSNLDSVDICPINLNPENTIYSTVIAG